MPGGATPRAARINYKNSALCPHCIHAIRLILTIKGHRFLIQYWRIFLFCTVTNKCTIISQIITLLHVSTLSCLSQGACNQYLAKLHKYFKCIFYCFVLWPTNAQLFHKLSHSYTFRHYRVILREPVINTLPRYTSISNAAVGNTVYI